jgi:hypothetical protein
MKVTAEIVNGKCPTCDQFTMLVGLTKEFYRCMNCGADLEQHVKSGGMMAKKFKDFVAHEPTHHKTSIGRKPSLCKMNKRKRKNFKAYKGQGK